MTREQAIRLTIVLEDIELDIIDSWRFLNGMPSRQAAMRELIRLGLKEEGLKFADVGGALQNYRVVHSPPR